MRMRSVRENKETVNNHTARWSKLLFGCVKYRKKNKNLFVFFSCFPKKEKLHAQKRSDCSAALQNNLIVIWSLTQSTCMSATSNVHDNTFYEQWNCQYSPRQFVSFINNFVFTFFFNLWTKIKTTRQTRVNVCDCSVVDEQFAADLISVYSFLSKIRIQICCLFTAQPTAATTTAATAFTLCVASEHIFITNWILMRIITQCLVVCLDLMHRRHWWWTKHMQFRQILFIKLMLIIMFWCSPLAAILSHYMHSVDAANTKNGRTP